MKKLSKSKIIKSIAKPPKSLSAHGKAMWIFKELNKQEAIKALMMRLSNL